MKASLKRLFQCVVIFLIGNVLIVFASTKFIQWPENTIEESIYISMIILCYISSVIWYAASKIIDAINNINK